jgi:hypothetical protein
VPQPFYADAIDIDRGPGWRLFRLGKQFWLWAWLAGKDPANLVPADALITVKAGKLADGGNDPLPGTSGGADRLDQRPVFIFFSGYLLVMTAQVHSPDYLLSYALNARGFSALHPVFKEQALKSLKFQRERC